jgi:hypothetical protein
MTHPLITWIGETRSGRISELRELGAAYVRTVNNNLPYAATAWWLDDLAGMGMLQLDWMRDEWSAVRPTITQLPGRFAYGIVYGSQPATLKDRLEQTDLEVTEVRSPTTQHGLPMPSTLVLQYDEVRELEAAALAAGSSYVACAAVWLSESLQPVSLGPVAAGPNWAGAPVERFNPKTLRFMPALPPHAEGLFRQKASNQWRHWTRDATSWNEANRSEAIAIELDRAEIGFLSWRPYPGDPAAGELFVVSGIEMPMTHTRTAVLCSGLAPRRGPTTGNRIYDNVPRDLASRIANSLRQNLSIV